MLKMCGVCGFAPIPESEANCINCGADGKSFESIMVTISCAQHVYRVQQVPFAGDREWGRTFFRAVTAPDGNPSYKYIANEPMFTIEVIDQQFVVRSDIEPSDGVNHWRLDGASLKKTGTSIDRVERRLELWSGRRHQVVMSLTVRLESFT